MPANNWIHILAPLAAILGHNYSIFLITRENGKIHFHGGAGGAPALGGAIGLWPGIFPYVVVGGALIWATTGIASLTTISIGLIIIIVFGINISKGIQDPAGYLVWDLCRAPAALGIASQPQKTDNRPGTGRQIQPERLAQGKKGSPGRIEEPTGRFEASLNDQRMNDTGIKNQLPDRQLIFYNPYCFF